MATFLLQDSTGAPVGHGEPPSVRDKRRRSTVLASREETPVKIGGSGKVKRSLGAVTSIAGGGSKGKYRGSTVTGSDGASVRMGRYRVSDALRLQGLPEDFLDHCPFTAEGKLKAVANGVAVPTGRAIARAILEAMKGGD